MNTRLCGKNNITNKKYLIYTAKRSHNNRKKIKIKHKINVRPELNKKLMAANIYIISLMSKSFV